MCALCQRLAVTGLESNTLRGLEDTALSFVPGDTIGARKLTLGNSHLSTKGQRSRIGVLLARLHGRLVDLVH